MKKLYLQINPETGAWTLHILSANGKYIEASHKISKNLAEDLIKIGVSSGD